MYIPKGIFDIDIIRLQAAGFGQRIGLGTSPAVLVIDLQNYMLGREGEDHLYPSSCGEAGRIALVRVQTLINKARANKLPIIYTRFVLDGPSDMGVYGLKRVYQNSAYWCVRGTLGAEIAEAVKPQQGDLVIEKKKPSAFFGTPLLSHLVQSRIDTLIIVGGATSSCIRATVIDAVSYNLRPIVVEDCVFDRVEASHQMSLFDMDRQLADVMPLKDLLPELSLEKEQKSDPPSNE